MNTYQVINPCYERDANGKPIRGFAIGDIVNDISENEVVRLIAAKCIEHIETTEKVIPNVENRMKPRGRPKKDVR